ncbi:MAG: helix-hairpin-helix domain-containing protein [Lachnospiraceae bacterium]|nr:helix-hairpin-helix domain-containing protein [Lachnospiraceae bacterium]
MLCGCKREKQTVFTETVYASDDIGDTRQDAIYEEQPEHAETICVFVCGAVNCEGVYELPESARVIDAVEAAGGYSEDADRIYVNQAEYVYDTQRVEIPTFEEAQRLREIEAEAAAEQGDSGSVRENGLIDINTADKQELMRIPGIGESKADRIIEYRQIHGRFGSIEELMNVSGIGSGIYEKMKDCIAVK